MLIGSLLEEQSRTQTDFIPLPVTGKAALV